MTADTDMLTFPTREAIASDLGVSMRRIQQFSNQGRLNIARVYSAPHEEMEALRHRRQARRHHDLVARRIT